MILRIFATDGATPERIFRWSVDETAEHLCAQQVLWVTRLDVPGWTKLVNWFVKHPSFRAVVLDAANRWGWYVEHEVTWRIAQGLFNHSGEEKEKYNEKVEAIYWGHDDMAPPAGEEFKAYLKDWLASDSDSLEAPSYQLWDDFGLVRDDAHGRALTSEVHCWLAKWKPELRWLDPTGTPKPKLERFRPLSSVDPWTSPWPFRHAKGVDKVFRENKGFVRNDFIDRWSGTVAQCKPYNPDEVWKV